MATRTVGGLGAVLTTADGRVLYLFEPDAQARVTCTGVCAQVWPPVTGVPSQFVPIQQALAERDRLNAVTVPVASAVFAVLPGVGAGGGLGRELLTGR